MNGNNVAIKIHDIVCNFIANFNFPSSTQNDFTIHAAQNECTRTHANTVHTHTHARKFKMIYTINGHSIKYVMLH